MRISLAVCLGLYAAADAIPFMGIAASSNDKRQLEHLLGGVGKGADTILDSTLHPVIKTEKGIVKVIEPLEAPLEGPSRRSPVDEIPGQKPSTKMEEAVHKLAEVIREESRPKLDKRGWLSDVLLVVKTLEPVVIPLIAA